MAEPQTILQPSLGHPNKNGAHVNEGYLNYGLENWPCMQKNVTVLPIPKHTTF